MSVFVASSPIGVLVGVGISGGGEVASGVCNALGAGTLIYVATEVRFHAFVPCFPERVTPQLGGLPPLSTEIHEVLNTL